MWILLLVFQTPFLFPDLSSIFLIIFLTFLSVLMETCRMRLLAFLTNASGSTVSGIVTRLETAKSFFRLHKLDSWQKRHLTFAFSLCWVACCSFLSCIWTDTYLVQLVSLHATKWLHYMQFLLLYSEIWHNNWNQGTFCVHLGTQLLFCSRVHWANQVTLLLFSDFLRSHSTLVNLEYRVLLIQHYLRSLHTHVDLYCIWGWFYATIKCCLYMTCQSQRNLQTCHWEFPRRQNVTVSVPYKKCPAITFLAEHST